MTRYRRNWTQGGTFFFTVNLADRSSRLLIERVDLLRQAIRYTRTRHSFTIEAVVVLPEHMHAIWTLPLGDKDYALRWRLIKSFFSRGVVPLERRSTSRIKKGEREIWQRRYWEHTIRDDIDFERHCDYIHYNPVKHGHVTSALEWPYSSLRRFIARGIYPADWGGSIDVREDNFGER